VGIDQYAQLPSDKWLQRAGMDACALSEYFQKAHPDGKWGLLVDSSKRLPNRVALVEGLHQLSKRVQKNEAGLFYFAGHAQQTEQGLVLATCDYRPRYPEDTGLALRRVFEILKTKPRVSKRFLVVLDCCRDGCLETLADDIPPNICVIYACNAGQQAHEFAEGGALTQALLRTFKDLVGEVAENITHPLHLVYQHLAPQMLVGTSRATPELCGSRADLILLPIVPVIKDPRRALRRPVVFLEARMDSPEKLRERRDSVGRSVLNWLGAPAQEAVQRELLQHYLQVRDDENLLRILLPEDSYHWTARHFLEYLLDKWVKTFDQLVLDWPHNLDPAVFRDLKRDFERGDWTQLPDGAHVLNWWNERDRMQFRGQVYVDRINGEGTAIRLTCQNKEARAFPLDYLLPSLGDMFERLRNSAG
jgi:hypothetical protein